MSTLEEKIDALEIPRPAQTPEGHGEDLAAWARRIAYLGALVGQQHAISHMTPAIIKVPVPVPAEPVEPTDMDEPGEDLADTGSGSFQTRDH